MILKTVGAFVAIVGFSFMINIPRKFIAYAGGVAALGWFVFLWLQEMGESIYVATFLSAITISVIAHIMARIMKTPVTIFNIPGIMPLVPGAGMYRIVYYTMEADSEKVSFYLNETALLAGLIAVSIFIADGVFRLFVKSESSSKKKKE